MEYLACGLQCNGGTIAAWGVVSRENCSSSCGDGLRSLLEMCDDGNTESGDGCSASCEYEEASFLGVWKCQARAAAFDAAGDKDIQNITLPQVNESVLLQVYYSAEAAAAAAHEVCRRDACNLEQGVSVAAAQQTAQVVTTGKFVLLSANL